MGLILASQSPRRQELLGLLKIPFSVQVTYADETMDPALTPGAAVAQVSRNKALAAEKKPVDVVVAADTVVVCDGVILGKPRDKEQAKQMLLLLSGRTHQVMTGLSVATDEGCESCTQITQVTFRPLSEREIDRYIATGEPMDKAGAYGIQAGAAPFVTGIEGDYFNVVGLPVCLLGQMLTRLAPFLMEEQE